MGRRLLLGLACFATGVALAEGLNAERLGVVYQTNDAASARVAEYYALHRRIPPGNVVGVELPYRDIIDRDELKELRAAIVEKLPASVQSLLLVWSRPYAVECMSITTAVAAGYQPGFCEPGCGRTIRSPLFDSSGWLPTDTTGWLPAMLLPSDDEAVARAVIDRGIQADDSHPPGTVYLVRTQDRARSVRSIAYPETEALLSARVEVRELVTPIDHPPSDIIAYFTGAVRVAELPMLTFRPGAAADHLTSYGGILDGLRQMSSLEWLRHGATASYGTVSEPCSHPGKFPDAEVFFEHYLRGDTLLVAYWKSVAMPGQGLFLARPYAEGP